MIMKPRLRKVMLTFHVACSVGLLGAVASFLALAIAGLNSQEVQTIRSAYVAMELTAWYVIIPLVLGAFVTGLVQALGTNWGLFRHFWVLAKLMLTLFVGIVLSLQMEGIGHMAAVASKGALAAADLVGLRTSLVVHAGGGLLVLLVPLALSLYKPRGVTRYGWRKQHERRAEARS